MSDNLISAQKIHDQENLMTSALFIIDFDLTITQEHIHNLLFNAIHQGLIAKDDLEAQWNFVKHVEPTGSNKKWKNLFETLIAEGNHVAIASFSEHKPIIERYLREKIGLSDALLENIFIESWLPKNPYTADKNEHIQNVINHFHFQGDPKFIVLVDDSKANCLGARKNSYTVIDVLSGDKEGKFISAVLEHAATLKTKTT